MFEKIKRPKGLIVDFTDPNIVRISGKVRGVGIRGQTRHLHTGLYPTNLSRKSTEIVVFRDVEAKLHLARTDGYGKPVTEATKLAVAVTIAREIVGMLMAPKKNPNKDKSKSRTRYDSEGNISGPYIPPKIGSKKGQLRATKAEVAACSRRALARGSSPSITCGPRSLKSMSKAAAGRAFFGFPKGWPKNTRVSNPSYPIDDRFLVRTFRADSGSPSDYGYGVWELSGGLPVIIDVSDTSEEAAAVSGVAAAHSLL